MGFRWPLDVLRDAFSDSGFSVTSPDERFVNRLVEAELVVSRLEGPRWLDGVEQVRLVRDVDDLSTYRNVVGETVRIDPETPFTRLDAVVGNVSDLESFRVVGQFEMEDGTVTERTRDFTASDDFPFEDRLPVVFELDRPAVAGRIDLETPTSAGRSPLRLSVLDHLSEVNLARPRSELELPAPRSPGGGPPIVLVSIDSLRYDAQEALEPLLSAFGGDGRVVEEPRTQGNWTAPSHGSMFTGLHPGDHGYVGFAKGYTHPLPIDPKLETLSTLLADHQYKCSALVSYTRLLPEFGFGDGFHRFRMNYMDLDGWMDRSPDARTCVDDLIAWIDEDADGRHDSLFYFLHVFDPHLPYIPPLWMLEDLPFDMPTVQRYRETARGHDYLELRDASLDVSEETLELIRAYYSRSVEFTASQIARVVEHLKHHSLYDDALIVVMGDHGQEFLERGFYTHQSLYDANIRPFVYVKPPADADWDVPAAADYIDVLPTVARAIGADPPAHCQGTPWQDAERPTEYRLTERIRPDYYTLSVERDGQKGLFTYEENYPARPSDEQIRDGPVDEEFVHLESVRRNGDPRPDLVDSTVREALRERAVRFMQRTPVHQADLAGEAAGGSRANVTARASNTSNADEG